MKQQRAVASFAFVWSGSRMTVMKNYAKHFSGKYIIMLGLGLLGRGLNDAKFFAECGAKLLITDMKSRKELMTSLAALKPYKNIRYVLGEHRFSDFEKGDMVLKAARVPLDSPYIALARKHSIPIEMDASLFARLAEGVTVVGITGTRGKTTTTHLVFNMLKAAGKRVYLGGNIRDMATLPLIKKIRKGDIVVLELDSWQLQGFGDAKLSPHVAVFTNFLDDHLDYYHGNRNLYFRDKAHIFAHQNKGDICIVSKQVIPWIKKKYRTHAKRCISVNETFVPRRWKLRVPGEHFRANVALASAAAKKLGIAVSVIRIVAESFASVGGRLERLRDVRGIAVYNDTCATTPDATCAALLALGKKKNIVLILGGHDKKLDMAKLLGLLPRYCASVVLLAGSGTDRIRVPMYKHKKLAVAEAATLKEAVATAFVCAKKGDIILFSPAFASFGMFKNEYDRGDQFIAVLKSMRP
ncbi:MAG: UDP-N-acetylmuramoylalanine--D-glutamate ligase [Parcubacteria group bacterium Gr01-1014_48]|nr:MAG: UDP-N-acetylmuramoylalanine--D-glutamate ligase [Parcubacteria group bacterium Greene0416_14]TSC73452.1 MAG: UDP-N-acetylmuramoylalanine--D-glutamate ligase [Parcubacteria group bacterium Gr01-1014_48]TSD00038.1 MAG: UDP-N-acetylmuramoylalanine--D-glutamate ligase [Parcubacteria group bacterium Greene1014_15]TSD07405.1 MAG: UDP-N-acetylmuramoylalanine--D-glutamate ligase [Parcubacteria group bacterium Greene0714_4]